MHKLGMWGLPCDMTNCSDVFSANTINASPTGFLSFISPNLSDMGGMTIAQQALVKEADLSAKSWKIATTLPHT